MVELAKKINIRHPIDARSVIIHKDPFHPNAYIITLPLDSDPSYVWHTLFEHELWSSLDFWDRKVAVVGKELKLSTTKDNMKEKLSWLEGLVVATNRRVEEHNKKAKAENEAKGTKLTDIQAIRTELENWLLKKTSI